MVRISFFFPEGKQCHNNYSKWRKGKKKVMQTRVLTFNISTFENATLVKIFWEHFIFFLCCTYGKYIHFFPYNIIVGERPFYLANLDFIKMYVMLLLLPFLFFFYLHLLNLGRNGIFMIMTKMLNVGFLFTCYRYLKE